MFTKSALIAFVVLASLVALSTQLKCYQCINTDGLCAAGSQVEVTCKRPEEICGIAQRKNEATGSRAESRGCILDVACEAANTRDVTPLIGKFDREAEQIKKLFALGNTKCTQCKTDLCNGGDVLFFP